MGLLNLWVGLPTPPGRPGGPPDFSRTYRSASRTSWWACRLLPDLRVCFPNLRVNLTTPTRPPGGTPDPSQTFWWDFRPLSDLRVGLSTPP